MATNPDKRLWRRLWQGLQNIQTIQGIWGSIGSGTILGVIARRLLDLSTAETVVFGVGALCLGLGLWPKNNTLPVAAWWRAFRERREILRNPYLRPPQPTRTDYAMVCRTPTPHGLRAELIASDWNVIPEAGLLVEGPDGFREWMDRVQPRREGGRREYHLPEHPHLPTGTYRVSIPRERYRFGVKTPQRQDVLTLNFDIASSGLIPDGMAGWEPSLNLIGDKGEFQIRGFGEKISGFRCEVVSNGFRAADDRIYPRLLRGKLALPKPSNHGAFLFPDDYYPKDAGKRLPTDVPFEDYSGSEWQIRWYGWRLNRAAKDGIELVFLNRMTIKNG